MKRLGMILMFLAATMAVGISLKAQEVTRTLMPGWTWISCPTTDTINLATAMGSFVPMQNDVITTQGGTAVYLNGQWRGNLSKFYPGYGYHYKSNRTEPVTVAFQMQQSSSQVAVATLEPADVTDVSAVVGGTVTINVGNHIFARGVCWGTEEMPTVDGSHTSGETIAGSQSITIDGLTPSTTYYVRAYAVTDYGLVYGNEVSFTTILIWTIEVTPNPADGGTITGTGDYEQNAVCTLTAIANEGYIFTNWIENCEVVSTDATYTFTVDASRTLVANFNLNHTYVDLGLPSGLLWATCNVGANVPEGYGDYFAWGETQPKDTYDLITYQHCNGDYNTLTKYCSDSSYGYNGFTDNLTTLEPEDDAATANWGSGWRMPTEGEWQELYQNTTVTWTTQNGVNGRLFTASNGNSLFLPAAGYHAGGIFYYAGGRGHYWSSSLDTDYSLNAWCFYFDSDIYLLASCGRNCGLSVRPVRSSVQNNIPTGALNGMFTINSDGDQVRFSQGNLQYIGSASTPYWKFADNQLDYLGDNGQGSTDQDVDRDLFAWGTSGFNHGAVYYQPWSTSTRDDDYYAYGSNSCNLYDRTGMADWGYNAISNGGDAYNQWRTLTRGEWSYMLKTRNTTSGIRYAKAQVNNVNGIIILPDNWNVYYFSLNSPNDYNASFDSNIITASQWSTLEQLGVVFLPASGKRNGTSINLVGSRGYYWTSSYNTSGGVFVVALCEYPLGIVGGNYARSNGVSVRLVCDVEEFGVEGEEFDR